MSLYEKEWQAVEARIAAAAAAAGRDPAGIALLAVSKTFPVESVRAMHALGQVRFGENYVQEARAKMEALADVPDLEWHAIGPVQTNKARLVAGLFSWVHSVDSERLARKLSEARAAHLPPLNVCVQVNVSDEASKCGLTPDHALLLALAVAPMPRLRLRGFMAVAQETSDVALQRSQFRRMANLIDAARARGLTLDTLSMGMSGDLEAAIAEGATLVRVGSALFGARPVLERRNKADVESPSRGGTP